MNDFRTVLCRFAPLAAPGLEGDAPEMLPVSPMSGGLINDTYALGSHYVLQRLHRIFRAEVNLDIAALTPHLRQAGVNVPTLMLARDGQPWTTIDDTQGPALAGVWRIMTRLDGATHARVASPQMAHSAGQTIAQFHGALANVAHAFAFTRPGAHDTALHMLRLQEAVAACSTHRLHAEVGPLAEELLVRWQAWGKAPLLPTRIVHGDLKISNLLFDGDTACAVLDLDTMAHGSLDIELGDALRSWCNSGTEDDPEPRLDVEVFGAALHGYLQGAGAWLTQAEVASLAPGLERICLELSARFAADALRESYFGWDPAKAPTRGEHNLMRARNQLGLGRAVARVLPRLQEDVAALWAARG